MNTKINPKLAPSNLQETITHALQNRNSVSITLGFNGTTVVEHVFQGRDLVKPYQPVAEDEAVIDFMQQHWLNGKAPKWFAVIRVSWHEEGKDHELVKIVTSLERAERELIYWRNVPGRAVSATCSQADRDTGEARFFEVKDSFYVGK